MNVNTYFVCQPWKYRISECYLGKWSDWGLCGEIKVLIFLLASVQDGFLFVDHPCFHFMLVDTLPFHNYPLSQLVIVPCGALVWGVGRSGIGGIAHIKVNDTETICPEWKRNGLICWWWKACEVMEGRSDKRMQVGTKGGMWWNCSLLEEQVNRWTLKAPIWSWHVKDMRGRMRTRRRRAREKDGTTNKKNAHRLAPDWVIRFRNGPECARVFVCYLHFMHCLAPITPYGKVVYCLDLWIWRTAHQWVALIWRVWWKEVSGVAGVWLSQTER